MLVIARALACAFLLGCTAPAASVADALKERLVHRVREIERATSGVLGFAAIDLATGQITGHNIDIVFPQASSIKIPVMAEVFHSFAEGRLSPGSQVTLTANDRVGGSGHLRAQLDAGPVTLSVDRLVAAMMRDSDNTATNKLIAMVGMEKVNERLAAMRLRQTRLRRMMMDSAAAQRGEENVSTPAEMATLAAMLYRGEVVSAEASRRMIAILQTVEADFRSAIPASVAVAAKPGELTGVRCETGIVFVEGRPFALSVMATFLEDGENPVPAVARAAWATFAKLAASNEYGNRVR